MNKNTLKKILLTIIASYVISLSLFYAIIRTPLSYANYFSTLDTFNFQSTKEVRIKSDGKIKILCLTDFHFSYLFDLTNIITLINVDKKIKQTNPDLIVLNGDIVWDIFNKPLLAQISKFFDSYKIPWAYLSGNHDSQFGFCESRLLSVLENSNYCVSSYGYTNLGSLGNSCAVFKDSSNQIIYSTFFINNGNKKITKEQCDWFEWTNENLSLIKGETLYNSVFMHVPLQIVNDQVEQNNYTGIINEPVSPVDSENRFLQSIRDYGTQNVYHGHDHTNNYELEYDGIKFKNCFGSSYSAYGYVWGGFARAATLIEIDYINNITTNTTLYY